MRLPESHRLRCGQIADEWIRHIDDAGHPVVGDLDDLRPHGVATGDEAEVLRRRLLESSLDAAANLLREVERVENAARRKQRPASPLRAARKQARRVSTRGRSWPSRPGREPIGWTLSPAP